MVQKNNQQGKREKGWFSQFKKENTTYGKVLIAFKQWDQRIESCCLDAAKTCPNLFRIQIGWRRQTLNYRIYAISFMKVCHNFLRPIGRSSGREYIFKNRRYFCWADNTIHDLNWSMGSSRWTNGCEITSKEIWTRNKRCSWPLSFRRLWNVLFFTVTLRQPKRLQRRMKRQVLMNATKGLMNARRKWLNWQNGTKGEMETFQCDLSKQLQENEKKLVLYRHENAQLQKEAEELKRKLATHNQPSTALHISRHADSFPVIWKICNDWPHKVNFCFILGWSIAGMVRCTVCEQVTQLLLSDKSERSWLNLFIFLLPSLYERIILQLAYCTLFYNCRLVELYTALPKIVPLS